MWKWLKKLFGGKQPKPRHVVPVVAAKIRHSLGIFWDIENCPVPHNKSPSDVVKHIRHHIDARHPECGFAKEFFVVADINRMDPFISDSLDRNGVNVVHVNGAAKNAADDKLQDLMSMFVDKFGAGAVLTVITGDINFTKSILNARRKDLIVVLIYGRSHSNDLKNLVNESYLYDDIVREAESVNNKLIIKGLLAEEDKNLIDLVRKLVDDWKDPKIKPEFISRVTRCRKDGKVLIVTATNLNNKRLLYSAYKRSSNYSQGIRWFDYTPKSYDNTNVPKDDTKRKSVIQGLKTKMNENVAKTVRDLVMSWSDNTLTGDLIVDVKRDERYAGKDGKALLFVTAVDPEASKALVNGAKKFKSSLNWFIV